MCIVVWVSGVYRCGQTPYTLRSTGQASLYVGVVQFSYKSKQVDKSDKTAF